MRLSTENTIMKEVLSHGLCTNCGNSMELGQLAFEGNDLRVENAKLRDEVIIQWIDFVIMQIN